MCIVRRTLLGLTALGLLGLVIGLSAGQNQFPEKPPTPPSGKSVATLTRYSMKLAANGLSVNVYPKDALHCFDSSDWFVECPVTVTAVRYDKDRQELLVSIDYTWRKSDEESLRAQLAWKYKEAGKPVAPEAISITPMEVAAHSLLLRDLQNEYLLFSTDKPTKMTAQTVVFRVPPMVVGADRLHERLSTQLDAVQLVFRPGYRFDRIAGLTVECRAINTAWSKLLEVVLPNATTKAESLLVDRDAEQELRRKLATEVTTVIRSYSLTPEEEKEALKLARAHIEMLSVPSAPLSVRELLELGEESLVFTAASGKLEAKPATNEEAITKLKEARSFSEKLSQLSESISDIANNSSINDRKFHSMARKLVLDAGASGGFAVFSAKANMHLDKSDNEITNNHLTEIKQARTYAMNKSAFSRDVQEAYSREVEGLLKKNESTAKLLRLRRVSAASLAATATQGYSVERVTDSEVLFIDTPIALKATPIPVEDDIVATLAKKLRENSAKLEALDTRLKATEGQSEQFTSALTTLLKSQAELVDDRKATFMTGVYHEDNDPNKFPSLVFHYGPDLLLINFDGHRYWANTDGNTITFNGGVKIKGTYSRVSFRGAEYDTIALDTGNTWRRVPLKSSPMPMKDK